MGTNSICLDKHKLKKPKTKKFDGLVIEYKECEDCAGRGVYEFSTHYSTIEQCYQCGGSGYTELPNKKVKQYRKFFDGEKK